MTKLKQELPKIDSQFHGSSHITKPGTNIFLDLGFSPNEAAELRLKSEQRIRERAVREAINKGKK